MPTVSAVKVAERELFNFFYFMQIAICFIIYVQVMQNDFKLLKLMRGLLSHNLIINAALKKFYEIFIHLEID